jgi:hypothetical protein
VVAYVVFAMRAAPHWYHWMLAFFSACLLFCSALGVNEVGVATTNTPGSGFGKAKPLFELWLRR